MMKRRNFLKIASTCCLLPPLITTTGCTHQRFYNPDQNIIIGGGRFKKNDEIRNVLAVTNLQQKDTQIVNTRFLPHGIIVDPTDKKRLIIFEKKGMGAAAIDLNNHEVITQFPADAGNNFSGNGVFDNTGQFIYSIESKIDNTDGKIIIRDGKTFDVVNVLSTYGKSPQDCKLINQGQIIVVSNRGDSNSGASITYVSTQENKLISKIKLEGNNINSCHFAMSKDNNLIITSSGSTNEIGQVHISQVGTSNTQHNLATMTEPKALTEKLFGYAASICIDEQRNIAAITHPGANLLTFWLIKERKLFKAMSVPNPRGITLTLNKKHYIVSYGIDTRSILIRTKNLVADQNTIMQPTMTSGERIINWSKILTEIMPGKIYD